MSNKTNQTEASAVRDARKIRDIKQYAILQIKLAKKFEIKQQKYIDRGVGISSIEAEYQFLGYLEGKRRHLEAVLRLTK